MSKQKRRRKELAGKKGDANGRSRSSLDFRVQTLGCQFIFSFYIKIHEYFILLFASEICCFDLFFSEKKETQIAIVVVKIKIYAMIYSYDKFYPKIHM